MYLFFKVCLLILRETETVRVGEGQRERKRGGQRIPSRLCTISREPDPGPNSEKREIMTGAHDQESDTQQTEPPRRPHDKDILKQLFPTKLPRAFSKLT